MFVVSVKQCFCLRCRNKTRNNNDTSSRNKLGPLKDYKQVVIQHRYRLSGATATVNCLQQCYLAPLGRKGQSMSTLLARWLKAKLCRVCKGSCQRRNRTPHGRRREPNREPFPACRLGRRQLPSAEPCHFSRHSNTAPCPHQHLPEYLIEHLPCISSIETFGCELTLLNTDTQVVLQDPVQEEL